MSEVTELIADAKDLVAKAERDAVDHADLTQLRIAVTRLGMFNEQLEQLNDRPAPDAEAVVESGSEPDESKVEEQPKPRPRARSKSKVEE